MPHKVVIAQGSRMTDRICRCAGIIVLKKTIGPCELAIRRSRPLSCQDQTHAAALALEAGVNAKTAGWFQTPPIHSRRPSWDSPTASQRQIRKGPGPCCGRALPNPPGFVSRNQRRPGPDRHGRECSSTAPNRGGRPVIATPTTGRQTSRRDRAAQCRRTSASSAEPREVSRLLALEPRGHHGAGGGDRGRHILARCSQPERRRVGAPHARGPQPARPGPDPGAEGGERATRVFAHRRRDLSRPL